MVYWNLIPLRKLWETRAIPSGGWESWDRYTLSPVHHCLRAVPKAPPPRCLQVKGFSQRHRGSSDKKKQVLEVRKGQSHRVWGTGKAQLLPALWHQQEESKAKSSLAQNPRNPRSWRNCRVVPIHRRHQDWLTWSIPFTSQHTVLWFIYIS